MWNSSLKKTDSPLRIGITGGIGSGKSMVCSLFRLLGADVFEADKAAKKLTSEDPRVKEKLVGQFGSEMYTPEGTLNRQRLASLIFRDPDALKAVNEIVHPLVREAFEKWLSCRTGPYVLMEAAILFESGFSRQMHANILVTAPEELRLERVMKRDGVSREDVLIRMKNQFREEESVQLADFVIRNDGEEMVIPQVLEMDKRLRVYQLTPNPSLRVERGGDPQSCG